MCGNMFDLQTDDHRGTMTNRMPVVECCNETEAYRVMRDCIAWRAGAHVRPRRRARLARWETIARCALMACGIVCRTLRDRIMHAMARIMAYRTTIQYPMSMNVDAAAIYGIVGRALVRSHLRRDERFTRPYPAVEITHVRVRHYTIAPSLRPRQISYDENNQMCMAQVRLRTVYSLEDVTRSDIISINIPACSTGMLALEYNVMLVPATNPW